jgi:hypothetical protein
VFGSIPGRANPYPNLGFREFPQSLYANAGKAPLLGHDRFFPNYFYFIIQQSPHRPMLYSLNTERSAK